MHDTGEYSIGDLAELFSVSPDGVPGPRPAGARHIAPKKPRHLSLKVNQDHRFCCKVRFLRVEFKNGYKNSKG